MQKGSKNKQMRLTIYINTSIRKNGGGANERSKVIRNNKIVNPWLYSHDNHSICLNYGIGYNYKQIKKQSVRFG